MKTWGPVTGFLGRRIGRAAGGHRAGTHTLPAAFLAGVVTHVAVNAGSWAAVVLVGLLIGLAFVAWEDLVPGRWERLWPVNVAASIAAAVVLVVADVVPAWLPAAVTIGWVAHIMGDAVTTGGVPLFAPFTWKRYRLTRLRTGGRWETPASWLFTVAATVLSARALV